MNAILLAMVDLGIIDRQTAERMSRNLDPLEMQLYAERKTIEAFQRGLIGQQSRLLDIVRTGSVPDDAFWDEESRRLFDAIADDLADVAQEAGIAASINAGGVGQWGLVDESIIAWVDEYYGGRGVGSTYSLTETSKRQFADAYIRWQRGEVSVGQGEGLEALINEITPIFGPQRAEAIGVTESTRIMAESKQAAAMQNDAILYMRLFTAADERVCPICGPMHNQTRPKAQLFYVHPTLGKVDRPPFHVRCRCREVEETALTIAVPSLYADQYEFVGDLPDPEADNG